MKQKSVEMKNKCFVWLMAILLMVPIGLSAQEITVKGNVTDSTGEGVIGASVVEKGNAGNGTITDINGDFTLKVSGKGKKLVVSYIGMQTQEIDAIAGKILSIKLQDDSKMLDEVVDCRLRYDEEERPDRFCFFYERQGTERYPCNFCFAGYERTSGRCERNGNGRFSRC